MATKSPVDNDVARAPKTVNILAVREVLQKYRDSTNLAILLLLIIWLPYAIMVNHAIQSSGDTNEAALFRLQSSMLAIGVCVSVATLITVANWVALSKVAAAFAEASPGWFALSNSTTATTPSKGREQEKLKNQ